MKFEQVGPYSFIYTFPFWLIVDSRRPPVTSCIEREGRRFRFYPPFRSAPANWLPMPLVDLATLPFLEGQKPRDLRQDGYLMSLASVPKLGIPGVQDFGITLDWGPDRGEPMLTPPMDSLRVDVIPLADATPPGSNIESVLRSFLSNLRVSSGQWWITRSIDPLVGWQRNFFKCDEYGKPAEDPIASGAARSPSGHERPISELLWNQALAATARGDDPELHDVLMADAYFHAVTSEHRQLVLDAAAACESLKERVIEKLWLQAHGGIYRRGKVLRGYDLPRHLDKDLHQICGRSFRVEYLKEFRGI